MSAYSAGHNFTVLSVFSFNQKNKEIQETKKKRNDKRNEQQRKANKNLQNKQTKNEEHNFTQNRVHFGASYVFVM